MVSRMRGDVWVLAAASAASNTGNWASVALALVVFAKTGSTVWLRPASCSPRCRRPW